MVLFAYFEEVLLVSKFKTFHHSVLAELLKGQLPFAKHHKYNLLNNAFIISLGFYWLTNKQTNYILS